MKQYNEINFKPGGKVIELGGGTNPLIRPNVDSIACPTVDLVADFNKPLPLESDFYDGVFSRYAIEHISWHNIEQFISELYRITKRNGKIIIVTANLLEQCKSVIKEGVNKATVERIFGSQEFADHAGAHKSGFSPLYATKLFKKAGFNYAKIYPHPVSTTDMIIEAYKMNNVFERQYFEDGTIGYGEYRDFATHYTTSRIIMEMKPESFLEIGAGRGYISRILEGKGVKCVAMDISQHCLHTRATENFILMDATVTPWQKPPGYSWTLPNGEYNFNDKDFDLIFSINFLEHIPEEHINNVIREMCRVSKRGLHGIHMLNPPFEEMDADRDITHCTMHDKNWWVNKFKTLAPDYEVTIEHPRILEYDMPERQPPVSTVFQEDDGLFKLNLGSFKDCFYYNWMNIDILDLSEFCKQQSYRFLQHDLTKGIPYKDNTIDIIFTSHFLEHIDRNQSKQFLKECYRVMKPGGVIRISVPNALQLTSEYIASDIKKYKHINVGVENAEDDAEAYYELLLAGHKTIYDESSLSDILKKIGFKKVENISPFKSRSKAIQAQTVNPHCSISLVIEAEK